MGRCRGWVKATDGKTELYQSEDCVAGECVTVCYSVTARNLHLNESFRRAGCLPSPALDTAKVPEHFPSVS